MTSRLLGLLLAALALLAPTGTHAQSVETNIPVLVPVTGPLALEGTSQRNGALLALKNAPAGVTARHEVTDTGGTPEGAVTAFERAMGRGQVSAVVASIFGPQMLAMLPLAQERKVPLITISGTAAITEQGNPFVFRFFPGDEVSKAAHVRYAAEELKARRTAVIYQTTAYGQSGRRHIAENVQKHRLELVFEEALELSARDMSPVLGKAKAAQPDVVLLHLHSGPTALVIRQAAAMNFGLPIVAGSAMHQPATAALLEPAELRGVCAETNASPVSGGTPAMDRFLEQYRREFNTEPDGFAVGQYDGTMMVLAAAARGARTTEQIRQALAANSFQGLAMSYKSDGKGNMAHSAVIVCYDGRTRVPVVAKRYDNIGGVTN
jgi:branched-chain amino acid transport system substrate-binding protein